jgi:autotransporter translocation and assembly factor TamB
LISLILQRLVLGGDVLSNIRGSVGGNASIEGKLQDPTINGRLFLDKAGLTIPYLNVDYMGLRIIP